MHLEASRRKKVILYTNFSACTKTLSAYLGCKVMRNNDSEETLSELKSWVQDSGPKVLLLDSRYSEGISFNGMDEIHILEPCSSDAQYQQAKARIIRFGSHGRGARVSVRLHVATLNPLVNETQRKAQWFLERSMQFFTVTQTDHKQSSTPDALMHRQNESIRESMAGLVKVLSGRSRGGPKMCQPRKPRCDFGDEIKSLKKC